MENILSSVATKIYEQGNHTGFVIAFKHLKPLCKKWSKNRDPDMSRVKDMTAYGGYIPKLIHLAELPDEGLVCYDGNHRREHMNTLEDQNTLCIVDIMFNASSDDIYQAFQAINKAVDVPEIYLGDFMNIKDDVLDLVKKYETTYKSFVSKSAKCRSPNFNRDVLTENITDIYKYLNGSKTIAEIGELLNTLNNEYSKNKMCKNHTKYPDAIVEKCKKHNLWLFLERRIPPEHVEGLMARKKFLGII